MKINEALKAELADWLDTFWKTYIIGDYDRWATFVSDDYYNIGGTKEEIWHSKEEILEYSYAMQDQMVGQAEIRNRKIEVLPYGDYLMVNEFTDLFVKIEGEWTFYGPFRMSSLMSKTETGWIALHQHGSYPDMKASEGEAFASDALKAENKRLQEAVEKRTNELLLKNRELEIEASLERVRTVAMGMKSPDDMLQVCQIISTELSNFGIAGIRNIQTVIIQEQKEIYLCYQYFPVYQKDIIEHTEYLKNPVELALVNRMLEAKDGYFEGSMKGEELEGFRTHRIEENHLSDPLMDEIEELFYFFYSIGPGALGITLYQELPSEGLTIFKRFHQVFSLTYSRFRDIEKAEAQTREAEIELALERVRAKTIAMHATSELQEVIHTVHQELTKLKIGIFGGSFIAINSEIDRELVVWGAGGTANTSDEVHIPPFDKPFYTNLVKGIKSKPSFFTEEFTQEEKKEFFTFLFTQEPWSTLTTEEKNETLSSPGGYTRSCCVSRHTSIFIINHFGKKFSEEENDILKRFGKVFEQTYTRFLDLQKAETQAREAQIEAAIERVRAHSMAMHHPDDLDKVNKEILSQLKWLQIQGLTGVTFYLIDENGWVKAWDFSSPGNTGDQSSFTLQFDSNKHEMLGFPFKMLLQTDLDYFVADYPLEKLEKAVHEFEEIDPAIAKIVRQALSTGKLNHQWTACCRISNGLLGIDLVSPPSEDIKAILLKMAGAFNQAYTRFLDLQKSEIQAREIEIELALERVRARTMAMQHSDELIETSELMFGQIKNLGIELWSCGFSLWYDDDSYFLGYNPGPSGKVGTPLRIPLTEDIFFTTIRDAKQRGDEFLVFESEGESLVETYRYMDGLPVIGETMRGYVAAGFPLPTFQVTHCGFFSNGHLMFITQEPNPEAINIFKRFTKVFDQTFTRFLDLQKAENQAREARIEAALERVRAAGMAMHRSEDLAEASTVLFEQLKELSVEARRVGFALPDEEKLEFTVWSTIRDDDGKARLLSAFLHYDQHPIYPKMIENWHAGQKTFGFELHGPDLQDYYKAWNKTFKTPDSLKKTIKENESEYYQFASFEQGLIYAFTAAPLSGEEHQLLSRFAKAFELTYTRFLDLQKAEGQAREARIEAALEKVRSRTMAMQHGEEVKDVVVLLYKELIALGVTNFVSCGYVEINEKTRRQETWVTSPGGDSLGLFYLPLTGDVYFDARYKAWKAQQTVFHQIVAGEERKNHLEYAITTFNSKEAEEMVLSQFPDPTVFYCFNFSHGYLHIVGGSYLKEEEEVLLARFTRVFEQTYARFLDLQKAEAQAREAQIEAALERVRSRTLAMQHSDELAETAAVLFHQLISLGVKHERINIGIVSEKEKLVEFWSTEQSGNIILKSFTGSISEPTVLHKLYQGWKQKQESLVIHLEGDELKQWITYCKKEIGIPFDNRQLGEQRFQTAAFFSKGMLMLTTHDQPPVESSELLIRFASVFNLTFTRFSDLKVAEANAVKAAHDLVEIKNAREKAEQALSDLKSAQEQLVQQEKLASLGQLTAGIAHEIKNPLNFVNNFSDLSRELIEEVFEVFDQMEDSKTKEEVLEILQDVRNNLNKIHEHGSRADSIVTSMLQHSRASGNKQELKEFNPIVKEFVNLSFHGMRAGKSPINVEIIQELDPMIKEVNLIQEDFSRVILNLCNNAFDAMRDKFLKTEDGRREPEDGNSYLPRLTVTTSLQKERVILSFADNGGGIPKEIQNKVFQPFFTTKKGTEGTGLGLSITHDIIKAHGGELKLETSLGEGSIFSISIPIR